MIEELRVSGVGGIKDARITFRGNFIVITGESGSGKSSLVRAMEFISGKRAQSSLIHASAEQSDVQLLVATDRLLPSLQEEYQPQDGALIARRTFDINGRGRCSLQGEMIQLSALTLVMEHELVIQSQFAQLRLLDPQKQLELVDSRGGEELAVVKRELETTFNRALELERRLVALRKERRETEERFQNAEGTLRKLHALEYSAGSQLEWEQELKGLELLTQKISLLSGIAGRFLGGSAGGGVIDALEELSRSLYEVDPKRWEPHVEPLLSSAQALKEQLLSETRGSQGLHELEDAKEAVENKLGAVRKLRRELNLAQNQNLAQYAAEAEERLAWLAAVRGELEELEQESALLRKKTAELAINLRAKRGRAASELARVVNSHLDDLAMEQARFEIIIEHLDKVRAGGAENAVFMLALPDQKPMPVGKTASGGELSRILIALQLASGDENLPGTLVFDEVEAGLGGRTAVLAGEKLRELSTRCRTVLITHEAAIAAMADQHFNVVRHGDETEIVEIGGPEREKEIARMLAGDESSQEALQHAKFLLANR